MKASQLIRGNAAVKTVELPMARQADGDAATAAVLVGLRALRPSDEADIYARARAYSKSRGADNPQEGEELYEYGKAMFRCLFGTVDVDAQTEPFFDGGIEQLEGMTELGKDGLLTLAEMHQAFTDEIAGLVSEIASDDGFARATEELAGPNGARFFFSLRPGLRVSYTLSSAKLLSTLLRDRSSSSCA